MKKTLLTSLACASLIAQETFTLTEQTVTATHLEQDELSYAAPVEIYTEQDIQDSKSKDIYDFLNQETSVITSGSGIASPFSQKIDMRGYGIGDGYQNIVVVVNGRRMNNVDMVPQLLSSIPIDSIEKIEIIKGAGSVENGDGANAGVISITTKDYNGANIRTYAGNFGTVYGSFGAGYADDLFSLSAFGDYYETDGQRDLQSGQDEDSGRSKNGSFDLKLYPIEGLELRTGWAATRIKTNYAGALTYDEYKDDPTQASTTGYDTVQSYDTDLWSLGLSYDLTPNWNLDTNLFIEDKESVYLAYNSAADYDYNSGDISATYANDTLSIAFGSEFFNGERDGYGSVTSKDTLAGFIKINYQLEKHSFSAGLRVEEISYEKSSAGTEPFDKKETQEAYELGYNYKVNKEQSVFASFAHAYQAPDLDRFFDFSGGFNPDINTMTSDTYNLGYNYFLENNKFKATIFYVDLKDEIFYNPITFSNTNLDETSKLGFEIFDKYIILDNLYLSANYTYIEAEIDKDEANPSYEGSTLPGVSKHNLTASIGYSPIIGSKLIASHTYRSSAYALEDFSNTDSQKQEVYNSTNLTASYEINKHFEVFAKVENLLDEDNGIWVRADAIFPANFQRSYYAGLNAKF